MPMDAGITLAFDERNDDPGACCVLPAWEDITRRLDWRKSACGAGEHSKVPGSRADAEEGVRLVYRAAGLSPPKIVWCGGPVELAHDWASAAANLGANAKQSLVERQCRRGLRRIEMFGCDKAGLVRTLFGGERSGVVSAAVQEAVIDEAGGIRPPLLAWMNRPLRSGGMRLSTRPLFTDAGYGPRDLCDAHLAADVAEAIDGDAGRALRGLRLIAGNAGWLLPHEDVCWLSLRPDVLRADKYGRLHCGTGPALRYPDGWALFAWKGTPVPAWTITQPEKMMLQWIDAQIDPRIRHAMIDILTPARFIASGGADRAGMDETGTLWKRRWRHRGVVIDSWAAVESVQGKGIFQCVPAELYTAREAFAWIATYRAATRPASLRPAGERRRDRRRAAYFWPS